MSVHMMPEELQRLCTKDTLGGVNQDPMLSETCEDLSEVNFMVFFGGTSNEDIVNISVAVGQTM